MYALDELARVVGPNRALTMPQRALDGALRGAGEWDWLRQLAPRQRRQLVGAGWLSSVGERPDVLGDMIAASVAGIDCTCAAMDWYTRMARLAIGEQRRDRHRDRHDRYAAEQGCRSYYHLRDTRAVLDGFDSLWHYRQTKGWT